MLKKSCLLRTLACFVLFPFLFIGAPENDPQNLILGDSFGLFTLPQDSEDTATTEKNKTLIGFFVTSVSRRSTPFDTVNPGTVIDTLPSEPILSVILRC